MATEKVKKTSAKTTKKSVMRKETGTRRTAKKQKTVKKPLFRAEAECAFYCNDGHLFYDLKELAEGLMAMSDNAFSHHVRGDNNDFSNWVRDVIGDIELANDLASAADKDECATYVVARLDYYE